MRSSAIDKPHTQKHYSAALAIATALTMLAIGGCTMTETQKRTGGGAALGALAGSLIGTSRESAAIGAAVGAAGGFMVDQHKKREEAVSDNDRLRAENERLRLEAENQRLRQETGQ